MTTIATRTKNSLGDLIGSVSDTYKFSGASICFLNTSDIYDGKVLNHKRISPKGLPGQAKKSIKRGDFLFSEIRPANRRFALIDFDSSEYVVSTKLMVLRCSPDIVPVYLKYFLTSKDNLQHLQMLAESRSGTFPQITFKQVADLEINLPPINEQRAIAKILSDLDEKIELNRRMNKTIESIARAIFKKWIIDAVQDGLPEGWHESTLGEVAENPRRGILPDEIEPTTPYIGLEHIPRRSIALSDWGQAQKLGSNKLEFKHGEILFGKLRPYFHKVAVAPLDGVCSTDILVIRPIKPSWFGFVLGHVSSTDLVNHTDSASTGTRMPRTNWGDIARFKVVLPPKPLATRLTVTIQPLVDRIMTNVHESRVLATIRDSLLPKLMNGSLRVRA